MRRKIVLSLLACAGVGACNPVSDVTDVQTLAFVRPQGAALDGTFALIPKGRVMAFIAQPLNGRETLKQDIVIEPVDEAIARVAPTSAMNQFVLIGVGIGTTELEVFDENGVLAAPRFSVEVVSP
jgi:hypothetical protein